MTAVGDPRVWRIRVRGTLSSTIVAGLPEVSVVESGSTTVVEGPGPLAEAVDHLQLFGLEVVEIHAARRPPPPPADT